MRRIFALCALLLLGGCAAFVESLKPTPAAPETMPETMDDRQLLVLSATDPAALIMQAEARGYALRRRDRLAGLDDTLLDFRIPAGTTIPEAIAEIEALSPGVTAGANHAYRLQAVASTATGPYFAGEMIGWPAAGCTAQRRVGLIDAGVAAPDAGFPGGALIRKRFHDGPEAAASDHGALMAELLIGEGRLTGATLLAADVIDPASPGGDRAGVDAILRALDWLVEDGASLINISLAGPYNKLLDRGLGHAADNGAILVAAAANAGPKAPPHYPAAYPFVLAVTAVDRDAAIYSRAVQGDYIDLAAPGVDIVIPSQGRLRIMTGTSAAAPHVTAAIAASAELREAASVDVVRDLLSASVSDLGPAGRDPIFGAGLLQMPTPCAP